MSKISFFDDNSLCVIPVRPRSKKPIPKDWQKRRFEDNEPAEFSDEINYGVVLGDASIGVVDIDLDCELARRLAPYFLPRTGWIFGRKSAPRSHWLYKVNDAGRGHKFNVKGRKEDGLDELGKFAEYRANGQMTVFPPSVHETGEAIEFAVFEAIGNSTRAGLMDSLTLMAICGIAIPLYGEGKRNDIVLALSGTLFTHGKSEQEVLRLVEVICEVTEDRERTSRLEAVRTTANRQINGLSFTQEGHLRELLGARAVDELLRYLDNHTPVDAGAAERSWAGALSLDDQNDTGVAKLFAVHAKHRVFFDAALGAFHVYRDGIWVSDDQELEVFSELDKFVQERIANLRANLNHVPHDQCAAQTKFLLKYRNRPNARNAIEQSRSFLSVDTGLLGRHDDTIAVRNGILRLREGKLEPFSPQHYITKRLEIDYDANAQCPVFRNVLSDAFDENEELISYFQAIVGYWLTGCTDRQEFYILHGMGSNGKSTILNAIAHVLGPYSGDLMSETIFEGSAGQHNSDLASLQGHHLAVVYEAESKFKLNAARIKQITGQDAVKVRALYKDPITFRPKFKLVVVCNKRPNLDAYDPALKRRIKLIPFDHVIPVERRDRQLGEKMKAEASGILNFMIEGARMYFRDEIREPVAVKAATQRYHADQELRWQLSQGQHRRGTWSNRCQGHALRRIRQLLRRRGHQCGDQGRFRQNPPRQELHGYAGGQRTQMEGTAFAVT